VTTPTPGADTAALVAALPWRDPARAAPFAAWLEAVAPAHGFDPRTLEPASADASFRRYFRLTGAGGTSAIAMDAPPPEEDVRPFVHVAGLLAAAGLHVPAVLAADTEHGFLLLGDLGRRPYLAELEAARSAGDAARASRLMRDAIGALVRLQRDVDASSLPPYDDALLRRELALFPEWCVERRFGVAWTDAQRGAWSAACDRLVASALAQPTVAVHRDWMPRNLMVADPNPGVLDFQDAVRGPITYDIASLVRDAFLSWEENEELDWAVRHWQAARAAGLPVEADFATHWRALEWMGLQRHLKVLGIFSRLEHRDGKPAYAKDLPRFFGYAHRVAVRYRELQPLALLLEPLMGVERIDAFR
jgi:aminoglycoside/choline kinase family phosphotransferase